MIRIETYLHRNGIVIERARREGRSLSYIERNIVMAGREAAENFGLTRLLIHSMEIEGEQQRDLVTEPIKVVVKFAYYFDGFEGDLPMADYHIMESNHPALVSGGNVGAETLEKNGIKIPSTPSFDKWVKNGRKCFRGGN